MRIYRIENSQGKGPYWNLSGLDKLNIFGDAHPHMDAKHPAVFKEFTYTQVYDMFRDKPFKCGFESMNKLYSWFSVSELYSLWELGYRVRVKQAYDYLVSEKQVLFIEEQVGLISQIRKGKT